MPQIALCIFSCLFRTCLRSIPLLLLHVHLQAKSKKLMWRMNRGIVKDLLPQSPLNIQIGTPTERFTVWGAHLNMCTACVCSEQSCFATRCTEQL